METQAVREILDSHGLETPKIKALCPDRENYDVLMIQPEGIIEADDNGVRNHGDPSVKQFSEYLEIAATRGADLLISPEYSMPWRVLRESILAGKVPRLGALWILGCESIRLAELKSLAEQLSDQALVIYENLTETSGRFLNPVAYVFETKPKDSTETKIVLLVQFKVCPFGDDRHFELNRLQCGLTVYVWGGDNSQIRLLTLICSDAFDFTEAQSQALYDRCLVVHIQLNANPRQQQFREYREHLLKYGGDATEIITLNWARNIKIVEGGETNDLKNIGGSA